MKIFNSDKIYLRFITSYEKSIPPIQVKRAQKTDYLINNLGNLISSLNIYKFEIHLNNIIFFN